MAVTVTDWQGFSAVTEAFTTVNDCWSAVILSTIYREDKKNDYQN